MPLSPEEVSDLVRARGYDPAEFDANPSTGEIKPRVKTQPTLSTTTASPVGAVGAATRSAALGVVPSVVSIPAGIEAATATGAALAPAMGPYAAIPAGIAGLGVGMGVGTLAVKAQDWLVGQSQAGRKFLDTTAQAQEEHPIAAAVGNIASTLPVMRPNLQMLKDAGHALTTEASGGAGLLNKLLQSQAVQQVGLGAGLGGGLSVGEDLATGHDVNWGKAAVNAVGQGLVSDVHGGVIKSLGEHAYRGQPLGILNDAQTRNVNTEVTTAKPVDPAVEVARQNEMAKITEEKKQLDDLHLAAEQQANDVSKAELQLKIDALAKRRAELQAEIDAPATPVKETISTASPEFQDWTRDKAEQKGVTDVKLNDTGPQTDKPYGQFNPENNSIEASTYAATKREGKPTPETNLPEYSTEEAPHLAGSKDQPVGVASTMVHEPIHAEVSNILNSESAAQTSRGEQLKAAVERDPRYKAWKDKTSATDKGWEEYLTRSTTRDFLADPMHKKRSWSEERKALARLDNGTATADDAVRILGMKFRYDAGTAPKAVVLANGSGVKNSEPFSTESSSTPVVDPQRQAFDERVKAHLDENKMNLKVLGKTGGGSPDFNKWVPAEQARFLKLDPSDWTKMRKAAEKTGLTATDIASVYERKNVQRVENPETREKVAVAREGARSLEDIQKEFTDKHLAEDPSNTPLTAEQAFNKHIKDVTHRALQKMPSDSRRRYLATDRAGEYSSRESDAFRELVSKTIQDVASSKVGKEGLDTAITRAAQRQVKDKLAAETDASKGKQRYREEQGAGTRKSKPVMSPADEHATGYEPETPGENAGEHGIEEPSTGQDVKAPERTHDTIRNQEGVLSAKMHSQDPREFNRRVADAMESAAADMENKTGTAAVEAEKKHTKILEDLLYQDPKRAKAIVEVLQENPENLHEIADKLRSGKLKLSEPAKEESPSIPASQDKTKQGWFEWAAPQFDQVRKFDVPTAEAMHKADAKKDEYEGKYLWLAKKEFHEQFPRATVEDQIAAQDYAVAQFRKRPLPDVTPEQEAMAKFWNDRIATPMRLEQNKQGMKIEMPDGKMRTAKVSDWYGADMLSPEAVKAFTESPDTAEAERLKNMWANYIVDASKDRSQPIDFKEAKSDIENFIRALGEGKGSSAEFGALRKAQGFGLPDALRERRLDRVMERYVRRASRDLANFQYLEKDPYVGARLGLDNPDTQMPYPTPEGGRLTSHGEVTKAMQFLNNSFDMAHSPKILAATRAVANSIMGPMSGLRDTVTVPVNALPYVNSVGGAVDIFKAMLRTREEVRNSLESGARTGTHRLDQFDTIDGVDRVANTFNKVAEALRKYSGRDAIEQGNRIWTFAIGKNLAERAIAESNTKFLDKFGAIAKNEDGTWDTNKLAKAFVDRNQGTYGGRGLPASSVDGMAAPWFSLARWSIEKSNVIYQDVIKPAYTKDANGNRNFGPLLTYTLGAYLSGAAIEKLTEALNNDKKMALPKWEELDAADAGVDRYVARLVNVLQLGSFAGMAGDALKMASDAVQGDTPRGFTVPAEDLIANGITGSLVNFSRAVRDGADPIDSAGILLKEFLKNQVQTARIANNWTDSEEVQRKNKFRDLRVWKQMTGREVPSSFEEANMALRPEERQLKKASTPEEVEALLPKIVADLQEQYKDDPWKLHKAIERLKSNSYQTFPSPKSDKPDAAAYYDYLTKAVGPEEAAARLEDYAQQSGLNRGKARALGAKR